MIQQTLYLPRREARRFRHTPLEQEDLVADGNLALARAAGRYDPSLGVPFPAFATPYVRGAIVDAVRMRARKSRLDEGRYVDVMVFSDLGGEVGGQKKEFEPRDPRPTPEETVLSLDRLKVLATLPERERIALIRTVVDGDTAEDVAHDLGVTAHRVYVLVSNGSARMRRRAA